MEVDYLSWRRVLGRAVPVQTRMHAAAALCAVRDGQLFADLQPDVVTALESALEGLGGNNSQVNIATQKVTS